MSSYVEIGEEGEMIPEVNPANTGNIFRDSEMNDMNRNAANHGRYTFSMNLVNSHNENR